MRILPATPLPKAEEAIARLRGAAGSAGDPARWLVTAAETRLRPDLTLALRNALLRRALGAWPAQTGDMPGKVQMGEEDVCFWGPEDAVATVRSWMGAAAVPPEADLAELPLGTATIRDGKEEFGPGAVELSRTCNLSPRPAALAVALQAAAHHARAAAPEAKASPQVYAAVVRNRIGDPGAGGAPDLHRVHTDDLCTEFLGVLPSFRHPLDGHVEVGDYRELPVEAGGEPPRVLHVADPDDAALAAALVAASPRLAGAAVAPPGPPPAGAPPGARLKKTKFHHAMHLGPADGRAVTAALAGAGEGPDALPVLAFVSLEEPGTRDVQVELHARGFWLCALIPRRPPGKRGPASALPARGVWGRVPPGAPLAVPAWLEDGAAPGEDALRERFRALLARWARG
jgi:hypothetical protein